MANEAIDSIVRNNRGALLCKLDIEKAYDHVDLSFLCWVMEKMGFGAKWIRWIKWCISIASFSVMIDGTSSGFFRSSRGLRQGDSLSPYLFVIVMEAFSQMIEKAIVGGLPDCLSCGWKGKRGSGSLSFIVYRLLREKKYIDSH